MVNKNTADKNSIEKLAIVYIEGVKISPTDPFSVLNFVKGYSFQRPGYICIFGLNILVRAVNNGELRSALNNSLLNPAHGKSIELYLRRSGFKSCKAVDGNYLLDRLLRSELSHFFYGTNEETLKLMEIRIRQEYPGAIIKGFKAPPYFTIDQIHENEFIKSDMEQMNRFKPDIVWIGLGGIKQDLLMYHYHKHFGNSLLIGVGAVFDYFAGNLKLSSAKVKNAGFRWLQRLILQPQLFGKIMGTFFLLIIISFRHFIGRLFNRKNRLT